MEKKSFNRVYNGIAKKKFLITFVIFFIWVSIGDSHSWFIRIKLEKNLVKLKTEKEFYKNKIMEDSIYLHELKTNKANLEKFAREKYLMKKDNEDIFVIVP